MPTKTSFLPLYNSYFQEASQSQATGKDWTPFSTKKEDFEKPFSAMPVDFSLQDRSWMDTTKLVISTILKIAVFSYLFYSIAGSITRGRTLQFIPLNRIKPLSNFLEKSLPNALIQRGPFVSKIILSVWALHTILRYVAQRLIMIPLYPAQSRIFKRIIGFRQNRLNQTRSEISQVLGEKGFLTRDVSLEKNGIRYSGLLIGHKDTINNGQWVLQATGNIQHIESPAQDYAEEFIKAGYNTLLINGPGVGKSQGEATPASMGDAQQVGIAFLETAIKAKKIALAGYSLGGAAIGQAVLKHDFKENVKYLVVRQMTFDRASTIAEIFVRPIPGQIFGYFNDGGYYKVAKVLFKITARILPRLRFIVPGFIKWAGCEMDSVAASKKLEKLKIKEVIIQAGKNEVPAEKLPTVNDFQDDGVIEAEVSLGRALIAEGVTHEKVFICLVGAGHSAFEAIEKTAEQIKLI